MTTYGGYIDRLSRKVEARLTDIEAVFNFDLGSEFEVAMCLLLQDILPAKFGVGRGFIVTEDGRKCGDDLIIYDKMSSPTLRASGGLQYAVKEQIPAEAVYAYIECKHSIDDVKVFDKAMLQVREAKELLLTRPPRKNDKYEKEGPTFNGKLRDWPRMYPLRKNQPFCAVFARNFSHEVTGTLLHDQYSPDLLVLGRNYIATQSVILGPDGIKGALFHDHKYSSGLRIEGAGTNAFGLGLLSLLQALNWIELLPIDWSNSLNAEYVSIAFGEK
jgi:hypothetical protein